MALTLAYTAKTSVPVEIAGLTPSWAQSKSLEEIRRFLVWHGNERLPLAELFDLSGSAADLRFNFQGDLAGVHRMGAGLTAGTIHVYGPSGRHLGSQMSGGELHVHGDAQDWVGAEMQGGLIHVHGSAGNLVGGAYRGSARGMTGGTILVDQQVGDEVGLRMRRGMIAIGGQAGHLLGAELLAGTVLVCGTCGPHPGAGMRRGTLGLLGPEPPTRLPSFRYACTAHPPILPLIFRALRGLGFALAPALLPTTCDLFHGDLLAGGRGEILLARPAGVRA